MEFIMSENTEKLEYAIIPKGSRVSVMGCTYTLLEDAKVDGMQTDLDQVLKAQKDFDKGVGVGSSVMEDATYESLSIHGKEEFAENRSISCKNLID